MFTSIKNFFKQRKELKIRLFLAKNFPYPTGLDEFKELYNFILTGRL